MCDLAGRLPPVAPDADGRARLRAWIGEFDDLYGRYFPVIQAWNEANNSDPELARLGARVLRGFIDRLVERVEENDAGPADGVARGALLMLSMVERSITFARGGLVRVDREELLDQLAGVLHVDLFGGSRDR